MGSVISFRALFCVVGGEDWGFIALVMVWSVSIPPHPLPRVCSFFGLLPTSNQYQKPALFRRFSAGQMRVIFHDQRLISFFGKCAPPPSSLTLSRSFNLWWYLGRLKMKWINARVMFIFAIIGKGLE